MDQFADIPIRIEPATAKPVEFGNALPILNEIRHALQRLAEHAEPTRIDLAAMPFGPGDEERLMTLLGRGEVEATINALGPTRLWETRFPGVWVVDYSNADDQRLTLQIEVDEVPQMLRTQRPDIADSLSALERELGSAPTAERTAPDD